MNNKAKWKFFIDSNAVRFGNEIYDIERGSPGKQDVACLEPDTSSIKQI